MSERFFVLEAFLTVKDDLPEFLRGLLTFAYKTRWRESETTNLTWSQVDLRENAVWLEVGSTKIRLIFDILN